MFKRSFLPLLLCLALLFSFCSQQPAEQAEMTVIGNNDRLDFSQIETGDIVLKKGRGSLSRMIAQKLHEPVAISHCGILVKSGDSIQVIHAVARELTGIDGVQSIGFNEFKKDCLKDLFYIVRPHDVPGTVTAQFALNYLSKKIPFDYSINYKDTNSVNCSELVYQVLKRASGKDLFNTLQIENQQVLAFNSMLDLKNFKIIYHY